MLNVVKVGGGLAPEGGEDALVELCQTLASLGRDHRLLVVPGGGRFADAARDYDGRLEPGPEAAHRMSIRAMDSFGELLAALIEDAHAGAELDAAIEATAAGRVAVLLPAALVIGESGLPADWEVTSDSIAAWIAGRAGAERLVLAKAAAGLYESWPPAGEPLARLDAVRLEALQARGAALGVDRHFPTALRAAGVAAWIVDGRDPSELIDLLRDGSAAGTLVTPA